MKKTNAFILLLATAATLTACGRQSTPSMVNTTRPQLTSETLLRQVPAAEVTQGRLYGIADDYRRYGADTMELFMVYDPESKTYTAMKAFEDLSSIKAKLQNMGVRSIKAETVKSEGATPTLLVSYDSVTAQPPEGCRNMPGFDDGLTTRHIGTYKFGCSVDTVMTKQIYRPADLQGNGSTDPIDGRRATNVIEHHRNVIQDEAEGDLDRFDRSDIEQ